MGLRLGDEAREFSCETSCGPMDSFLKWKDGCWAVLFSHPEDFTPVCTTELSQVALMKSEWEKRNVKVIGLSCNTSESHRRWIKDINEYAQCEVDFPIIADPNRSIATLYDMLDYQDRTNVDSHGMPWTVRSVFIIDPKNIIRTIITYPASTGRNFHEVLRVIDSLQLCDKHRVATPANWEKGQDVIVHVGVSDKEAKDIFPAGIVSAPVPYLRFTHEPVDR